MTGDNRTTSCRLVSGFRIAVARSFAEVDEADWTRVVHEARAPVFYGSEYVRAYESHPLGSLAGAVYLTAYLGERPVAVLPAFLQPEPDPLALLPAERSGGAGLLGHVWYCYDGGIPTVSADLPGLYAAMLQTLVEVGTELGVTVSGLVNVAADNPVLGAARELGWTTPAVDARWCVPVAGFNGLEDYLATLSRDARHNMRRRLRRADEVGVTSSVAPTDPATTARICELTRRTVERFGSSDLYPPEVFVPFVQNLGDRAVVIRVDAPGGMVAGAIALLDDTHLHLWVGGYDRAAHHASPYYVLWATAVQAAIARGLPVLEVGRRNEEFKRRHGAVRTPLHLCLPADARRRRRFPVSWQQRRAFVQARRYGLTPAELGGGTFVVAGAYRLRGPVDAAQLGRAVRAVVARHEALRTTFDRTGEEPEAVIHPSMPIALEVEELADDESLGRRVGEIVRHEVFDLDAGPLLRVRLLRVTPDDAVLLVSMHHIVSDGWSMGIVLRELAMHYNAYRDGATPALAPPPVQYGDYAVRQTETDRASQLDYWRGQLRDIEALVLPSIRREADAVTRRAEHVGIEVSGAQLVSWRELGRRRRATLHMVLLAGLTALLSGLSGSPDIAIGTPVANRNPVDTESTVGVFTNTLIVRTRLAGPIAFDDLLDAVRATAIAAYRHPDVPPESLVDSGEVPVRVVLALQSELVELPELDGVVVSEHSLPASVSKYDLVFALDERGGTLRGHLEYRADSFDRALAHRLADAWQRLLGAAADNPARPVSELLRYGAEIRAIMSPGHPRSG